MHHLPAKLHLRFGIAGDTIRYRNLLANVKEACALVARPKCRVELIDAMEDPQRAIRDRIFATPTIVVASSDPGRQYIGNMLSADEVIRRLHLGGPAR